MPSPTPQGSHVDSAPTVAVTVAVLTAGFLVLGYVFLGLDRVVGKVFHSKEGSEHPEGEKGKGQA